MALTDAQFLAKWPDPTGPFADNEFERIVEGTFRDFARDVYELLNGSVARRYDPAIANWKVGEQMVIAFGDIDYAFTASVGGGPWPAPDSATDNDTRPWQPLGPPTAPLALSGRYELAYVQQNLLGQSGAAQNILFGRDYVLRGAWNGGLATQLVFVRGLPGGVFDVEGTLLSGGQLSRVEVDVAAGTAVPAGSQALPSPSAQLTNTVVAQYVDVFLENPAAQLASVEGLANFSGLQAQVINPETNAPAATESAYLPDVQASLAAAWTAGATRLLLRCQILPLRNGLVAHARLHFSQPATAWPQSPAPHASGFRLYGNAFAMQAVEWTHANGMQVTGSNLYNPSVAYGASGSPQASYVGANSGLLMAMEFTHNKSYSYLDYIGFSDANTPNNSGSNLSATFYITQGRDWHARIGNTELASGSLLASQYRFRIEVYDDHVAWLVDGAVVWTMVGSLTATTLWPSATLGNESGISDCLFGGQTISPR